MRLGRYDVGKGSNSRENFFVNKYFRDGVLTYLWERDVLKINDKSTFGRISRPGAGFRLSRHFGRCDATPALFFTRIGEVIDQVTFSKKTKKIRTGPHFILLLNSKTCLEHLQLLNFKRQIQK